MKNQQFYPRVYWVSILTPIICLTLVALMVFQSSLPLLFLGVLGLGIWVFLIRNPAISLMFMVAGFYYYTFAFDILGIPLSSNATIIFWLTFTTSALIGYYHKSDNKLKIYLNSPIIFLFVLFLFWHLISWGVVSEFSEEATKRLGFAVFMMIIPFIIGLLMDSNQTKQFLLLVIISGILGSIIAVLRFAMGDFSQTLRYSISESTGVLQFVYSLGTGLLALLSLTFARGDRRLWLLVTIQYILVYSLVFAAGSRGPLLIITAATLVLWILSGIWSVRIKTIFAICAASLGIAAVIPLLPPYAIERIGWLLSWLSEIDINADSNSLRLASGGRSVIWMESLSIWTTSPLFGIGLAGTESSTRGGFAHNVILEILVEQGIIGLIIFTCFLCLIGQRALRLYQLSYDNHMIRMVLVLHLYTLMSLMISGRIQGNPLFWLSCGLIVSLSTHLPDNTNPKKVVANTVKLKLARFEMHSHYCSRA